LATVFGFLGCLDANGWVVLPHAIRAGVGDQRPRACDLDVLLVRVLPRELVYLLPEAAFTLLVKVRVIERA
jgi:hypothetical protein